MYFDVAFFDNEYFVNIFDNKIIVKCFNYKNIVTSVRRTSRYCDTHVKKPAFFAQRGVAPTDPISILTLCEYKHFSAF